jgi:circadian clock protein KaiB
MAGSARSNVLPGAARGLLLRDVDASPITLTVALPRVSALRLKLFIAGDSPRTREAAANLARACGELLAGEVHVDTVDVLEHPELADEYRILTTPTVVREAPAPRRRVTGDLRDIAQVLAALAIFPPNFPTTPP